MITVMKQNENKVSRYINKANLFLLKYLRGSKSQELQSLIVKITTFTNIIRIVKSRKMSGHMARMLVIRKAYKIFVGKGEGMRRLRGQTRTGEDNIGCY
jgi:Asp-tRNA(Asn)/Glu-tRNA(Gln) amidotransferase B subunit